MTTFNTDYNNTELLDQELTIEQLETVAGGLAPVGTDQWYTDLGVEDTNHGRWLDFSNGWMYP